MARIAGIDLPRNKRIEIALTYIYGIGRSSSKKMLEQLEIDPSKKAAELTDQEVNSLREHIEREATVEGDLRRTVSMNIKRLMELGMYRGHRHRRSLPTRGQRTNTNARTRKGPKRLAVAAAKKAV